MSISNESNSRELAMKTEEDLISRSSGETDTYTNEQIPNETSINTDNSGEALEPTVFRKQSADLERGRATGTELSRVESSPLATRQLSRALSGIDGRFGSRTATRLSKAPSNQQIPQMGGNKPLPREYPDPDMYTVDFDGPDDPLIPFNWTIRKKLFVSTVVAVHSSLISWASAIFSPAIVTVGHRFGVSREVATLGLSLYVLGFATGPVIWAPLCELYGRKPIMVLSGIGMTLFQFAVATGKDIQTVLICRAFGGAISAAPLVCVPAIFGDIYRDETRGKAITVFIMTIFIFPIVAPVVGGFIVNSYLGWRWTEYLTGIMGSFTTLMIIFFYPETHHPILLVSKAHKIKELTGNWMIHAAHDEFTLTIKDIVEKNLSRPLVMLVTEPIILLISIYNAFVYGILYLMLSAYPVIFAEGYGMKGGVSELPYLGMVVGMVFAGVFAFLMEGKYVKALRANNHKPVPKARLYTLFYGCFAFPIGLFWLFWTGAYPKHVHWMAPTASGVFTGFGLVTIFTSSINFILDTYLAFSASAMAANAFLRAIFACAFPLFGVQMLHNMGVQWAGLLLGLIGVILIPVPFLFYKYGDKLRDKSKFAYELE